MKPYRLLTSRAEYRLILRQDNADLRLTEKGYQVGLIPEERYAMFVEKREAISRELERLNRVYSKTGTGNKSAASIFIRRRVK
jgi:tRNA uridine 5-carboxymethylaminomethyl modification enzyme